jgi:4-amino-4-deoxy-L-arabinose transferase-like glycosyltransferase
VLLWGAWLVTQVAFFSVASQFQPYYMVMMAPAVAALVGIGSVELWQAYRSPEWTGWLLPASLLGCVAVAAYILIPFPDWNRRLLPGVLFLGIPAVVVLVVTRFRGRYPARLLYPAAVAGMLAVLVAPTAWAAIPVWNGSGSRPYAGPEMTHGRGPASLAQYEGVNGGTALTGFDATEPVVDHRLVNYLLGHWDTERYLVATLNANVSAPIILETGAPVMTLGGFLGTDPILTSNQLAALVTGGGIRFFLLPETTGEQGGNDGAARAGQQGDNVRWVNAHCRPVPADLWQTTPSAQAPGLSDGGTQRFRGFGGSQQLFDCSGAGKQAAVAETAG